MDLQKIAELLTPADNGEISPGANVTLTIALAALLIAGRLEKVEDECARIASALEELNEQQRKI